MRVEHVGNEEPSEAGATVHFSVDSSIICPAAQYFHIHYCSSIQILRYKQHTQHDGRQHEIISCLRRHDDRALRQGRAKNDSLRRSTQLSVRVVF